MLAGDELDPTAPRPGVPSEGIAITVTTPTRPGGGPPDHQPGLLEVLNELLKRWRLLVGVPLGAAVLAGVVAFVWPPTFTATTAFLPESGQQSSISGGLLGIAGQIGASLGFSADQPSRFYADLAQRRDVLLPVLDQKYPDPRAHRTPGDSVSLLELLGPESGTQAQRIHAALKRFRGRLDVSVNNETGVVSVSVGSRYPTLAAAVANRLIGSLDTFNMVQRQSTARDRRVFIEGRLTLAQKRLTDAESALKDFYTRNRTWQSSPELTFEEGRLHRQVDLSQQLYVSLREQYETARIDEVNDTPVLTVVQRAVPPVERSWPKRKLLVLVGFLVGVALAFGAALTATQLDRLRATDPTSYDEFRYRLRQLPQDVRAALYLPPRRRQP